MSLRPKSCDHQGQGYIKIILALSCQKSCPLSRGQNALDDPKIMKEHTQFPDR